MDRNGYNPSILRGGECCYLCGRMDRKLDRHEIFGGANRDKSKADGLWVLLCHDPCHRNAHEKPDITKLLRARAERAWLDEYGLTVEDFVIRYGKNYLGVIPNR